MNKTRLAAIAALILLVGIWTVGCSSSDDENPPVNNPPDTPTGLAAHQTVRTSVTLNWTDVADEELYRLQRSPDSSAWAALPTVAANTVNAGDATITGNRKYWYKVRAENQYGNSEYSAPVSIWTWPTVFEFVTDQTDEFTAHSLEGTGDYHEWGWDNAAEAGRLTITTPDADQHLTSVVTDGTMPGDGWFECMLSVGQWFKQTGQAPSQVGLFVERDPTFVGDVVGFFFSQDSTRFGYYLAGDETMRRLATNPELPLLTDNAWHTIRLFHSGDTWTVYIDGAVEWTGTIANVATGTTLYQEWQFDRGDGPDNQDFWLDDVAYSTVVALDARSGLTPGAKPVIRR